MPVIMATAKRLFSMEHSYVDSKMNSFDNDESDFKAVYKNNYISYEGNRFSDLVKYVYENIDNIIVHYNGNTFNPIDGLKEMIRLYSKVLRPESKR